MERKDKVPGGSNFVAYPSKRVMNYMPPTKDRGTTGIGKPIGENVSQEHQPPPPVSPPYGRSGRGRKSM